MNKEMTAKRNSDISDLVNNYFDKEDYESAKNKLLETIEEFTDDHWLYAQLSICFYELFDYKTALKHSQKAIELSPECPLALNYHAIILFANEKVEIAEKIWQQILTKDIKELANCRCGEGLRFAKSLKNDIRFRLGDVYVELNNKEKALKYYKEHLQNRKRGQFSNFTRKEVETEIIKLQKQII